MKYRVMGTLTIDYAVEVEAESEDEAGRIAEEDLEIDTLIDGEIGYRNEVDFCDGVKEIGP